MSVETQIKDFIVIFTSILYEAMPFIVLGALIAGILEVMVPQKLIARIIPKSAALSIAIGGVLGLIFPMCECGIIPVMRRLLRKGVPLSACVCYLLAGPIINFVVMGSTSVAFSGMETDRVGVGENSMRHLSGIEMMGLRVFFGYLVAFGTSLVVEWQYRKHGASLLMPLAVPQISKTEDDTDEVPPSFLKKIGLVTETALHDFVDITVFLILGAILAGLTRLWISTNQIADLSMNYPLLAILLMMALAILLCLCSEADAFVAASFKTMWPSAKIAFLVLGPMMDLKLYMMYTRVFRPRLIWTIIPCVFVQTLGYSLLLHFLLVKFGQDVLGLPVELKSASP